MMMYTTQRVRRVDFYTRQTGGKLKPILKKIMTCKIGSTRRVFAGLSDQMFVF